jgi:outer membrane protein assembly factor BamD
MRRLLAAAALLLLAACAAKNKNPEQGFLNEVGSQSKEQILAKGDEFAAKKKWEEARKYYAFLADSFPNDPVGRKAAIKVADTFYNARDPESLTEAQLRYKDFANRFPNDPSRAYALLMLGKVSYAQRKGPLRDLTALREAAENLKQEVQLFPNSPYTKEARELLSKCLEDLAKHEYLIASYYANVGAWAGARQRLEFLFANYPDTETAKTAASLMKKVQERFSPPPMPSPTPTPTKKSAR